MSVIGKHEKELGLVCDQLQCWLESRLGEMTDFLGHVELVLTRYTSAITIGGHVVWDSESVQFVPTFENCRDAFQEAIQNVARLLKPTPPGPPAVPKPPHPRDFA